MEDIGALNTGLQPPTPEASPTADSGAQATATATTTATLAAAPPLWALIIIVIAGTGLAALLVGLCCLCACRRGRRGNNSGKLVFLHGVPDRACSDGGGGGSSHDERVRGRLRKRRRRASAAGLDSSGGGGYYYDDHNDGDGHDDDDDDGEGEIGFREISPVRKVSLLVVPGFLGRRGSLNPFAGHGGGVGHHGLPRRMSNVWVDEDTLHGPKMTSAKLITGDHLTTTTSTAATTSRKATVVKSWQRSLRESWPLNTLSSTLPRVPTFESITVQEHPEGITRDSFSMFDYKDYHARVPELPPPLDHVARQYDGQEGSSPSPRPLPRPPRQALLAGSRASAVVHRTGGGWAGARPVGEVIQSYRGLSYYKYEDTGEPVRSTYSLRTRPRGGVEVETDMNSTRMGRLSSTGSTLSVILKDTEMRLQERTATGSARRNRLSTSPPKTTAAAVVASSPASAGPDGSTATLVGSAPQTPSPPKHPRPLSGSAGVASAHTRQTSDASVVSETDSMVGDDSPGRLYHGLTSPSRSKPPPPQQQQLSPHNRKLSRTASLTSSVASSLSDISEENSMVSGTTPNTTAQDSSIPADMNKISGLAGDLFMATGDTAPAVNSAVPRNRGVYPASRGVHGTLERQRGRQTSEETLFTMTQSPLSLISGISRSPEPSPTRVAERANGNRSPQLQRAQPAAIHLTAPAWWENPSDDIHKRESPGRSMPTGMVIPSLSLTSPSADGDSPTPKLQGVLRRLESPPKLVHGLQFRDREELPDMEPPSPALANNNTRLPSMYDIYGQMDSNSSSSQATTSATRRRAAGEVRKISEDTTTSSSYYSDQDQGVYEREKMAALDELNVLLNQDIRTGQPRVNATATATVRMVLPEQGHNIRNQEVPSTMAELRRMNSQISAAASGYSDDSTAIARPEVVSPPRKGAAARNYLALGSPPKSTGPRGLQDKENDDRKGSKRLRMGVDDDNGMMRSGLAMRIGTPVRNRRHEQVQVQEMARERNRSEESLGLYDEDGFLISPERRLVLRTWK